MITSVYKQSLMDDGKTVDMENNWLVLAALEVDGVEFRIMSLPCSLTSSSAR